MPRSKIVDALARARPRPPTTSRGTLGRILKPRIVPNVTAEDASPTYPSNKPAFGNDQPSAVFELPRKPKGEWKRRQGGQMFLDHLIINVRAGKGGDGCVAFHREKFKPFGPPSGGNGGKGGDVYIRAVEGLTSLGGITKRIRGAPGANGQGTWMHGRSAPDVVIDVPVGTVVREIASAMPSEEAQEEEAMRGLTEEEKLKKARDRRWVHYPLYEEANIEREAFLQAEAAMKREERAKRLERRRSPKAPIYIDFDRPSIGNGVRVAEGGSGGFGNPFFHSTTNRSPKFATRGSEGTALTLELELKLLADIGLVGMPNAGKSTLLRALTNSKAEVAPYAFTTLNPQVGMVRVWDENGHYGIEGRIVEDSETERAQLGDLFLASAKERRPQVAEAMRFKVADNPGLIARASENHGLGHSFLRSIERSLALVYVVDLSSPAPWDDLKTVRDELEAYKPGLSKNARMVIANKADLLGGEEQSGPAVEEAWAKLRKLEEHVKEITAADGKSLDVVPASAKFSQNLQRVVKLLQGYVREVREEKGKFEHADVYRQ